MNCEGLKSSLLDASLFTDAVSSLLRQLYNDAERMTVSDFRESVVSSLSQVVCFDNLEWGLNAEEMMEDSADAGVLLSLSQYQNSGARCWLKLYRDTGGRPFDESERRLLDFVFSHLVETAGRNLVYTLREHQDSTVSGLSSEWAICSEQGLLYQANEAFTKLLHLEFPDWQGPVLPWPPQQLKDTAGLIKGKRTVVRFEHREFLVFVQLRPRKLIDDLSEAELRVARTLALGDTYKGVARTLGLSPSTVNNHAVSVYRKLGVENKSQLVRLWPKLEQGPADN